MLECGNIRFQRFNVKFKKKIKKINPVNLKLFYTIIQKSVKPPTEFIILLFKNIKRVASWHTFLHTL